jgi:prophage regulatory protein
MEIRSRFLRLPAVLALIGVSKATLYAWVKAGHFPTPHQLGQRAVAWLESEVIAWIDAKGRRA